MKADEQAVYQIRVVGILDEPRRDWFNGLTITPQANGDTMLSGPVRDQAALHGLLVKVRDMDVFYNPDVTSTIWRVSVDGSATQLATMTGMSRDHAFSLDLEQVAFMRVSPKDVSMREMHIADVKGAWDIVYREGEVLTVPQWKRFGDAPEFLFYQRGEPLLGLLCQEPIILQPRSDPAGFVHNISWVDDQRYLYLLDDQTLHLGALDGSRSFVGAVSDEVRRGTRALAIYDFSLNRMSP